MSFNDSDQHADEADSVGKTVVNRFICSSAHG